MNTNSKCLCCHVDTLKEIIDFGPQPPSNRFVVQGASDGETHALKVGQCTSCGMVQLINPMAFAMAKSRFEWITYNEPEGHLDDLVSKLCQLPGLEKDARIIGLTYKDDTTLQRLNKLGYENTYRYDVAADLGLDDACVGLESIQDAYNEKRVAELKEKHGMADLLSVRHILEHAHDPRAFLATIRTLVKPGGYLWFEMPDCSKFIKARDYVFFWEEHITYFSPTIMNTFAREADLGVVDVIVYPYQFEDSLVAIAKNEPWSDEKRSSLPVTSVADLLGEGQSLSTGFSETAAKLRAVLEKWRSDGKRVAVFGAGHLAARFLNIYGLGEMVECAVDDHPAKQGLTMPGSGVPIVGSARLGEIDICLLSLSSESERKVRANNQEYLERGGIFMSIFADNNNSIYSEG